MTTVLKSVVFGHALLEILEVKVTNSYTVKMLEIWIIKVS